MRDAFDLKRVLIITYYWPPNAGAGVYRWLKFAKYLPQHGWQPVIYTPGNPQLVAEDAGLLRDVPPEAEVIKRPIREPYGLYKRLTGRKGERIHTAFLSETKRRSSPMERIALRVRGELFIPDARVAWVKPSIRFLTEYLKEHRVDAAVTTGPPHSMHLIGLGLKKALGLRWIADFRDPWTNIDFYQQLKLSPRTDLRHRALEAEVLKNADLTIAVGWTLADELRALGAKKVEVITNGYDPDDVPTPPEPVDEAFSLVHVGSLTATRDAPQLWKALKQFCDRDPEFARRLALRFVGPVDRSVIESIEAAGLGDKVQRIGSVSHAEAMRHMQRARVLLLLLNDTPNARGILTSKLFEYLSVGRPILAVGEGDVERVLGEGHVLRSRKTIDHIAIQKVFKEGTTVHSERSEAYSRTASADRLAGMLE